MDPVKRDILEVALSAFSQYGFEGTRIEAITARTHTSKRMIYYHFGGKEALYAAVLEYAYRKVREGEDFQPLDALAPLDALVAFATNAFNRFSKCPDFIRLNTQENLQGAHVLKRSSTITEMNRALLTVIEGIVQRGQADGSIRPDVTPMNLYVNLIGLCNYHISARYTYLALFDYDFAQPENAQSRRESICDAVLRFAQATP
jgi:AcrR family transcriptional regulator